LTKAAAELLEALANHCKSKKERRANYYPLMTMLCLLIPDKFNQAIANIAKGDAKDTVSTHIM
jgi:uncharacterized protein YlxP (DUF503 family)